MKEALGQKAMAASKIKLAIESPDDTITVVVDYCKNLQVPHLGADQPGDTYYFSPIWVYCLGIVDTKYNKLYV